MTFAEAFDPAATRRLAEHAQRASEQEVRAALTRDARELMPLACVAALLSPAAARMLEELARRAHRSTIERFGKTIALFAPLYLSNDCVCTCTYCGFSRGLDIRRRTLDLDEVMREASLLAGQGMRSILLVSSEHPKRVSLPYLTECVAAVKRIVPYVGLEVAALDGTGYKACVEAGCDGIVLYQETYDPQLYPRYHTGGPKKNYVFRLGAPERASAAGARHLGIGALLGLGDWRFEVLALVQHARYLAAHCWRSQVNVSLPRINASAGGFVPEVPVGDAELAQIVCVLRLALPAAGIVLSTRERAALRDGLVRLGVTHMSAGSSTEPGGYTTPGRAGEQFHLEDRRSPAEVAARLTELGYEAVFKDWERLSDEPAARRQETIRA
jgi:2-iminoacetate synthase